MLRGSSGQGHQIKLRLIEVLFPLRRLLPRDLAAGPRAYRSPVYGGGAPRDRSSIVASTLPDGCRKSRAWHHWVTCWLTARCRTERCRHPHGARHDVGWSEETGLAATTVRLRRMACHTRRSCQDLRPSRVQAAAAEYQRPPPDLHIGTLKTVGQYGLRV